MTNNNHTDNFIIFSINGGAGKNVLATAVVKAIKKHLPEMNIIILTGHKDIWLYNPNIYRCYQYGNAPYFYQDYINGKKNIKIFSTEPYASNDYILKKKHLIEIWCDLYKIPYNNEKPELFFNQREIEYAERGLVKGTKIFLIQTNGGAQQDIKMSWMRDLPLSMAQKVVDHFKNDYRIIHVRRPDQPALLNTEQMNGGLREIFLYIKFSEKRLFIDSVCQHAASALEKVSTVTWVRNDPQMLGYSIHDNIVTRVEDELNTFSDSLLEQYDIQGDIVQCPFKEGTELFNAQEIIDSIMNQKQS